MSGTFGVTGGAEFTHMSAAKAGMIGFTRALAREVGHDGINVNCIAPAIIRTDLYNFMPEDMRDSSSAPIRSAASAKSRTSLPRRCFLLPRTATISPGRHSVRPAATSWSDVEQTIVMERGLL